MRGGGGVAPIHVVGRGGRLLPFGDGEQGDGGHGAAPRPGDGPDLLCAVLEAPLAGAPGPLPRPGLHLAVSGDAGGGLFRAEGNRGLRLGDALVAVRSDPALLPVSLSPAGAVAERAHPRLRHLPGGDGGGGGAVRSGRAAARGADPAGVVARAGAGFLWAVVLLDPGAHLERGAGGDPDGGGAPDVPAPGGADRARRGGGVHTLETDVGREGGAPPGAAARGAGRGAHGARRTHGGAERGLQERTLDLADRRRPLA